MPNLIYIEHETCELITKQDGEVPAVGASLTVPDMGSQEPITGTVAAVFGDEVRLTVTSGHVTTDADDDDEPARFRNSYACPQCKTEWADVADCTCDDRCPTCRLSCSPVDSEDA